MEWKEKFKIFVKEFVKALSIWIIIGVVFLIVAIPFAMFYFEMLKVMNVWEATWILFGVMIIFAIIISCVIFALIETHEKSKTKN